MYVYIYIYIYIYIHIYCPFLGRSCMTRSCRGGVIQFCCLLPMLWLDVQLRGRPYTKTNLKDIVLYCPMSSCIILYYQILLWKAILPKYALQVWA